MVVMHKRGTVPAKSKRAFGIGSGIAIAIGVAIATVLRVDMNQKFGRQFCIISTTIPIAIAIPMPIPTWSQDFALALMSGEVPACALVPGAPAAGEIPSPRETPRRKIALSVRRFCEPIVHPPGCGRDSGCIADA